jgi:hypothetical protein
MLNPKTTVPGVLLILGSVLTVVAHFMMGQVVTTEVMAIIQSILVMLGGGALVAAKDGSA